MREQFRRIFPGKCIEIGGADFPVIQMMIVNENGGAGGGSGVHQTAEDDGEI